MEQLVSGEEKQRWEGERERLVARIKELQVAATLHLHTPLITSAANRLIGEVVQSWRRPLLGPSPG